MLQAGHSSLPTTLCLLVGCLVSQGAAAAPGVYASYGPLSVLGRDRDALQLGLGLFDWRTTDQAEGVANLEYRIGHKLFFLGPAVGLVASSSGALFGYGGIYADIVIGPVTVTPQMALGGYDKGNSRDLGGVFEFRQSLDVAYNLPGRRRLGFRYAHISNADIHSINPGEDEMQLTFSIPLGPFF